MSSGYEKITLLDKWHLVRKVVSDPGLSRCGVACGFHLIDLYNTRLHRAWPSYDTLATLTGANRRTVITAVSRLLASEYFEVDRGSGRRSNYYRPNFKLINSVPQQSTAGDQDTTTSGAQTSPLQGVAVNSSPPNTSYVPVAPSVGDKEVSPRSAGSSARRAPSPSRGAPPGFKEFWQAYPKKEGRKAALTAYAMALQRENVTPELLAAKATQYAEAKGANDPRYIKMPRYWLDDECWLEDPQPSGKKKPSKAPEKSQPGKTTRAKRSTTATKTPNPRRPKKSGDIVAYPPTSFGKYVPLYCEFLGITLEDLATVTGIPARDLRKACTGKAKIRNEMKDKARSLLIEAVVYHPKDEALTVDWLRNRYILEIEDAPPNHYPWRRPEHYERAGLSSHGV